MKTQVYLAFYKGKKQGWKPKAVIARLSDWLTRKLTKGIYSHCEIVIKAEGEEHYQCYSSSIRDGGVRQKTMLLDSDKWDLIELFGVNEAQIIRYFNQTQGSRYDWFGAIGVVFGIPHARSKFFCSEWCANAINGGTQGWRFSPNDLAAIFRVKQNEKGKADRVWQSSS
ncbi:enoyl-CoA hydratase [Volucribacter amazonae]